MELCALTGELNLEKHVTFIRSFSDAQKRTLLKHSTCLIYTPDGEHFGIVPIEAMYMHCPVIAVRSGGPLETVASGVTGFLCDQTAEDFAHVMRRFVDDEGLAPKLGKAGYRRVMEKFSFAAFTSQLNNVVDQLCAT
jgi:alpha-1,3/alpha-1,6-mannosyltransferase